MAAIRGTGTKQELVVRSRLHALGFRFRIHDTRLPGKPDLVLPRWKAVIFIHGCFWHGHDCPLFKWPSTREDFWREKIGRNRQRDAASEATLDAAGWRVLRIWECSMKGPGRIGVDTVISLTTDWLRSNGPRGEIRGTERAGERSD
jgi:DNA mismatch endonuclease (patch repair protein)